MGRLELSDTLRWEWRGSDERLDAMLWPVIRSAADLLTSGEVGPDPRLRRSGVRLDVRGPEPQRAPALVSDAYLRNPGEDAEATSLTA